MTLTNVWLDNRPLGLGTQRSAIEAQKSPSRDALDTRRRNALKRFWTPSSEVAVIIEIVEG